MTAPSRPLALELEKLTPQRLVSLPPGEAAVLVDLDRANLVHTLGAFVECNPDAAITGYHLTGEAAPPEPLRLDSRPPIPHVTLEEILRNPTVVPALSMWVPYPVAAFIHERTRRYVTVPEPARHASFVFERVPDFYETRRAQLEAAYALLRGRDSRTAFARVVKARMTGESAFLAPTGDMYGHARTDAAPGDTVIDGGVFRFEEELRQFSLAVGETGKIYAFEPERDNLLRIRESMRGHAPANVTLCEMGLFSDRRTLGISAGQSASALVATAVSGSSPCEVTDLDSFAAENALSRIDLIKLDIEGAEIAALMGARGILRRFRPKLKISAYHTPDHLWEIPLFLHALVPEYAFEFRTPAPELVEYILFAYTPGRA